VADPRGRRARQLQDLADRHGYGAETTFGLDELRALAPCRIEEILRLEPMIERLIMESRDFDGFLDAYRGSLDGLRGAGSSASSRSSPTAPDCSSSTSTTRPRRRPSPRSTNRAAETAGSGSSQRRCSTI
jgi:hypothetical protein